MTLSANEYHDHLKTTAVRAGFDRDSAAVRDEASWKALRDAWLGRKSGVLTRITEQWLKPAPADLRRSVGQCLNELKAHVEQRVEEYRHNGADAMALMFDVTDEQAVTALVEHRYGR